MRMVFGAAKRGCEPRVREGTKTMQGHDLKATFVIAVVWLIGITMYTVWLVPLESRQERSGYLDVASSAPQGGRLLAVDRAPKDAKLPILWAHQRWGAD